MVLHNITTYTESNLIEKSIGGLFLEYKSWVAPFSFFEKGEAKPPSGLIL
jgi:hypothetical protein